MKLLQQARMTPAQNAWCAAASDAQRHAFILGGEIKVLVGLDLGGSTRFAPTVHGVRVRLVDQPGTYSTPGEAHGAAETLKAQLTADLVANGVVLPNLDLTALGLLDAPDDEETETLDEQDLVLALLSFQDLEQLETAAPAENIPLNIDRDRLNLMPVSVPGAASMKTVRPAPQPGREERLNPYLRPLW